MEQRYALKAPDAWLWTGNWTREDLLARLRLGKLEDRLLICPVGEAKEAIPLRRFASDPDIFQNRKAKFAEWKRAQEEIAKTVEKPWLRMAGARLLQIWGASYLIGGATISFGKSLFPMLGWDLGLIAVPLIVGVWSLCGVGIVVWLAGWAQHRRRIRERLKSEPPFDPESV